MTQILFTPSLNNIVFAYLKSHGLYVTRILIGGHNFCVIKFTLAKYYYLENVDYPSISLFKIYLFSLERQI